MESEVAEALFVFGESMFLAVVRQANADMLEGGIEAAIVAHEIAKFAAKRIVEHTKRVVGNSLTLNESLFRRLEQLLEDLFGDSRVRRIITTTGTKIETRAIEFIAEDKEVDEAGTRDRIKVTKLQRAKDGTIKAVNGKRIKAGSTLGGVVADIDIKNGLAKALGKRPKFNKDGSLPASELVEPSTVEGHEGRKFKMIWRLNPLCNHCSFCPLIAGTDSLFYKRFVEGPPAHVNCCCNVEIVSVDFPEKTRPQVVLVLQAAREIGLI